MFPKLAYNLILKKDEKKEKKNITRRKRSYCKRK